MGKRSDEMPVPARDGGTAGNGEDRIAQMGEDAAMTDGAAQDRDGENGEAAIDRTVVIGGKRVRYIDPLSDWGFKTLFGSEANKEFLIALLQTLFPRKRITDISYLRNENQGLSGSDRKSVFDVVCMTRERERFVVEVQKKDQEHFRDRALYYSTFPIREQGRRGDWDYALTPVCMVGILNFGMEHRYPAGEEDRWRDRRVHRYELRECETGELMTENLRFVFLEVGTFDKGAGELETYMDRWMYTLKNMPGLYCMPSELEESVFGRIFRAAEIAAYDRERINQYERDMMTENDYRNTIAFARKKAIAEGLAEGEARGLAKGEAKGKAAERILIAKALKGQGVAIETIAAATGLSAQEIARL